MSESDYQDLGLDDLVDDYEDKKPKKENILEGIIQTTSINTNNSVL